MKYGGIPEQSSNVMMSLVPNPRSSFVPSSELPLKCRSVMKSHLLNKEEMPMLVAIEKLEKISKGLHPKHGKARSRNHLYLVEFFLCHLFRLKLLLWTTLYHGRERPPCAIPKTSIFKASSNRYLLLLPAFS